MSLCQNVHRRGGVYWWRRRGAAAIGRKRPYIQLSLRVRDPEHARRLSRLVGVEADRIANLVGMGMLNTNQQKELLKRFIAEQVVHLDKVAVKVTSKPTLDENGERIEPVELYERLERKLSVVFNIIAVGGAEQRPLKDADMQRLREDGFSEREVYEIYQWVDEFAPAYAQFGKGVPTPIGPDFEFYEGVLTQMRIAVSPETIEHARRLWMRAQAVALQKTDRRWGINPKHFADLYEAAMESASNAEAANDSARLPPLPPPLSNLAAAAPITLVIPPANIPISAPVEPAKPSASDKPPGSITALVELMVMNRINAGEFKWKMVGGVKIYKTADQHRSIARFLVKVVGSDDPAKLTAAHLTELRHRLGTVPVTFGKSEKDWTTPFEKIIEKYEAKKKVANEKQQQAEQARKSAIAAGELKPEPARRRPKSELAAVNGRKPATINRWMTQLGSILNYLSANGFDVPKSEALKVHRAKDNEPEDQKRHRFTEPDCDAIFAHPVWRGCASAIDRLSPGPVILHDALYWVPILCCHLITRLSEVCSAELADVDCENPAINVWLNGIRGTKNDGSERRIPLPKSILRLGFLNYVAALKARGEVLLFPELQRRAPNSALENTFENSWAPVLNAALPNRKLEKKSLHSFRHRGNYWMINANVLDVIRCDVMGQLPSSVNERVYKDPFPDETKLEALAHLPDVTAALVQAPILLSPLLDA